MARKNILWSYDTNDWDEKEMIDNYREAFDIDESEDVDMDKVMDFADWTNLNYLSDLDYDFDYYDTYTQLPEEYIVVGKLGLWNGTFDGGKIIHGLKNSVHECFEDYNEIYYEGKMLKVKAIHHDGTNIFKIKQLTWKGVDYYNKYKFTMGARELHERLFNDSHYSKCIVLWN